MYALAHTLISRGTQYSPTSPAYSPTSPQVSPFRRFVLQIRVIAHLELVFWLVVSIHLLARLTVQRVHRFVSTVQYSARVSSSPYILRRLCISTRRPARHIVPQVRRCVSSSLKGVSIIRKTHQAFYCLCSILRLARLIALLVRK
jgi:uncharacterized protein YggT (Ycf19 family)